MAKGKADKIVGKLKRLVDEGEYYEAHQLYRTLYHRFLNGKRYEELQELMYDGAHDLLSKRQFNSGADLASLYLESVSKDPCIKSRLMDDAVCAQFTQRVGDLLHKIPAKSNERFSFMVAALKMKADVFPLPLIHYQFAMTLWREKNFSESRYHFLRSPESCGEECALMLIEYHIAFGYPSEVDLFIAQFILQLLCVRNAKNTAKRSNQTNVAGCSGNNVNANGSLQLNASGCRSTQHSYANKALECFTSRHPQIQRNNPPFLLPLLNFLWFLLLAIDSGKSTTFKVLCELYSPTLKRDPSYSEYLSKIGELYFGLQSTVNRRATGLFGNLLQSLFEDNDESDENGDEQTTDSIRDRQVLHEDLD